MEELDEDEVEEQKQFSKNVDSLKSTIRKGLANRDQHRNNKMGKENLRP